METAKRTQFDEDFTRQTHAYLDISKWLNIIKRLDIS